MNTHFSKFPLSRVIAVAFAATALCMSVLAASASAATSDLAFTSTAPTGVKYGATVAYTPVASSTNSTGAITYAIDSGSAAVCKLTTGVVSVTGAGTCKIVATQAADVTYDLTTANQSFSVAKSALTVTALSSSNFYGGVAPSFGPIYSGFVGSDTSSNLKTKPTCSTTAIVVSNPGAYETKCSGAAADNYSFTYVNGSYSIVKSPLIVVPSATVKLGRSPKSITLTGYGWQAWDDEFSNDLNGRPKCSFPKAAKKKPGKYQLKCSIGKLTSANYALTLIPGVLKVKKK